MIHVNPTAEPFFIHGNNTALLFIHGFTASPSEVYPVAKKIHEVNGITISSIILPGHGSHPHFLNQTTWDDWYKAVKNECQFLLDNYEQVYVAGLSLGGLLAIYLGQNYPTLKGVIAINPPFKLQDSRARIKARLFKGIRPYRAKERAPQQLLAKQGRFAYDYIPLKAFLSMMNLRDIALKGLEKWTLPLLLIQSLADETVDPRGAFLVMDRVKPNLVKLVELPSSPHVATMGKDEELIADMMIEFMGQN